ncbi:arylesterase [Mucilaginibacter sp. 44-25]|uniref:arylesterase n=1 Tax=Mucilaginibacter sp. 44-25 TaxID=1895794 RepID=UPI000962811E|nr:arylesterase [Mucilaginibacter sp. 44-25]OJW14955.1 MAG: hypothetical protein BGO48_12380 [Mucilaginibacter sp. 44-25]
MKHILFFGDSLTAGYGLANPAKESFPALLDNKMRLAGFEYEISNAGVSGDTTAGGLSRLNYWLSKTVDIFVLELGINDLRHGIPPTQIAHNLQLIVNQVRERYPAAKLLLLGMQIPFAASGGAVAAFNAIYRNIAEANHLPLVPFILKGVAGQRHLNLQDRFHPSAEGYKIVTENIGPALSALL